MQMHKAANGQLTYIAEMDDEHLTNTILLLLNNFKIATAALSAGDDSNLNSVLFERRTLSKDKAKRLIKNMYESLPAYVMEANIRGMDVREDLQNAFGRDRKLGDVPMFLLPAESDYDYDDDIKF